MIVLINRSIKLKIIISTASIVTVCLLFSGTIFYLYFSKILKQQVIQDDQVKLNQTAYQLNDMISNVRTFTETLMVDENLQTFLKKDTNRDDVYDILDGRNEIVRKLNKYFALRNDVQSFYIVKGEQEVTLSTSPLDESVRESLDEPWFGDFIHAHQDGGFTSPHFIHNDTSLEKKSEVISYAVNILDIDHYDHAIGKLIINFYFDHFVNIVQSNAASYEQYWWVNGDRQILYRKADTPLLNDNFNARSSFEENKSGFVYKSSVGDQWHIISYTSKKQILHKINYIFTFILLMIGASIVAILLILTPLINNITKPILKLTRAMKQVSAGNLNMNITIQSKDELEVLGLGFNRMLEDLRGHIQESLENEKIKQQLEIDLLLSQINPHFIYNTLNTVIYLARKQRHQDITEMMTAFIHILQDAVRIGNNEVFSSVEKEVGIIQDYTKIQKYRYRDQFELYLYISDNVSTIDMPKNILQPIIENALFHGILPKETKGMITLSIHLENDRLVVNISDDGVGMTPEAIESMDSNGNAAYSSEGRIRNIGLTNVKKRLELLFGSEYFLAIDSIPQEGTSLTIHIPTKNRSGTMLI